MNQRDFISEVLDTIERVGYGIEAVKEAKRFISVIDSMNRVNQNIVRRAMELWDYGEAEVPEFSSWCLLYRDREWERIVREN